MIECLLDANSMIKYYINLTGSDVIKYLFNRISIVKINITNIQVVEVISLFYKFCREGKISIQQREEFKDTFLNDIRIKKILLYDFVNEHILDFDVYDKITVIPPPTKRPKLTFIPIYKGYIKELKDIADSSDTIMLTIMREVHLLTNGDCLLFTSDGHVQDVAKALGLKVIDPEKTGIKNLPKELYERKYEREIVKLKAICVDCDSLTQLPVFKAVNLCMDGVCLKINNRLDIGKRLHIKLDTYGFPIKSEKTEGRVVWSDDYNAGIKFSNAINLLDLID